MEEGTWEEEEGRGEEEGKKGEKKQRKGSRGMEGVGKGWQAATRCREIPFVAFGELDLSTSIDSRTSLLL